MVNFENISNITFQICAIRDTTATPIAMNGHCTLCNYLTINSKDGFLAKLILNKYVNAFDLYLQKRNCTGNTRKFYLKTLRAILNKAIQEGEASLNTYPFGKNGFQVAKLTEEASKRYLPAAYMEKIKRTPSSVATNELARRLFCFPTIVAE